MSDMKIGKRWSDWVEMTCCDCDFHNFISLGKTDDPTGFDTPCFRCWKCGTAQLLHKDFKMREDELEELAETGKRLELGETKER